MKVLKRTLLLCVIFTMLMSMFVVSQAFAAVADYKIWMEASSTEVEVGQQVSVNVYVTDRLDLAGAAMKIKWNPEYLYMSDKSYEDDDTGEVINEGYENMPSVLMKYAFTPNLNDAEDKGIAIFMGARNNSGSAFTSPSANYLLGTLKFTVLEAAAGKNVDIGFVVSELEEVKGEMVDVAKTYCNDANAATIRFAEYNGVSLNVAGGEPAAPTADSIGLWTGGVAKLTNQAVTNSDGSKYEVKTGLAFLSCVKTDANATDLKTVITCADREGELVIAAGDKVYVDTDDNLTYFGAAVTSIRDINLTQAFTAKAVATVGETVVTGNGATATYAE